MSQSTLALITVPVLTGVIGYVTNWTGVLMLFYPVHFKGVRAPWLHAISRVLPYKVRQIPGVMIGGIGWQGIVPSRAAKMGSLAVDSGISKIGTPQEFFQELDPEQIARQIVDSTRDDIHGIVERIMAREQPQLWHDLPPQVKNMVHKRVQDQLPEVVRELTVEIGEHIDQLVDVKLMVIKRFDPELANRVFLDMGQRELKFIQNFGFFFGFLLGIPVAALTHFVTVLVAAADPRRAGRLRHQLGRAVDDLRAGRATAVGTAARARAVHPPPARCRGGLRGDRRRRDPDRGRVRLRASQRTPVRPHAGADRALDAPGHRPGHRRRPGRRCRVAIGSREYESIRQSFATEPIEHMMAPLTDPAFSETQSTRMRKLITDRIRAMDPRDFAELLRTATKEDEWLLLLHGAVLGLAGGLIHLAIFG